MKIRGKIILGFLILTVVSSVASFFIIQYFVKEIVVESIGNYNALLARGYIEFIDQTIYHRLERWQSYVQGDQSLFGALRISNQEFDTMENRDEYIKNKDAAWQNAGEEEITDFMQSIINTPLSAGLMTRLKFYDNQNGYKVFPEIFITNKYGVNIAQAGKTSDYYQADESWWQKAKAEGHWISDIVYDDSSGVYGLEISIRINDQNDNFLGVIKIFYNIRDVFSIIDEIVDTSSDGDHASEISTPRETVNIYLLTDDGKLIYLSRDGAGNLIDRSDLIDKFKITTITHRAYFVGMEQGVERLFSHYHSEGYKDFKGSGWFLLISKDTSEALLPLNKIKNYTAIGFLVSIISAIFLSLFISKSLTKPIRKLHLGIEIIEHGNLSHKVGIPGRDEISQLSRSFDKMTANIKKLYASVDKKVLQQTQEIINKQKDMENQQKAIMNILEDIDEEKENIKTEKDKINTVLQSIGDAVFVVDNRFRIMVFNPAAAVISGYSIEEALGKPYDKILKFIYEKDGRVNNAFVKEAISSGQTKEMANHTILIRKNGSRVAVADSASPLKDRFGQMSGCVVVFRDVTKEREIDKMKTEFVSLASHQLRTPLSAIKWFLEMLLNGDAGKINGEQTEYLQQAFDSNERMITLVNSLLNISRIEAGRLALDPKPTDFIALSKIIVQELTPSIKARNLNFKFIKPNSLPKVNVDSELISQVIKNLLSNSIKYTPARGQIDYKIEIKGKDIVFTVKDTGMGIPKNQQYKLFQKFFRADNVAAKDTEGTGLGLYVAKSVVELSGGQIDFESVENKGTTFWFSLPLTGSKKIKGERKLEKIKI